MVVVDGQGIPLGIHVAKASPSEMTLVDATLSTIGVRRGRRLRQPARLIADRAYDSDALRARLARRGITVIVPYRENRTVRQYQDRRHLRRYRHRWIVERTFARWAAFGGS
jgi:transposase